MIEFIKFQYKFLIFIFVVTGIIGWTPMLIATTDWYWCLFSHMLGFNTGFISRYLSSKGKI